MRVQDANAAGHLATSSSFLQPDRKSNPVDGTFEASKGVKYPSPGKRVVKQPCKQQMSCDKQCVAMGRVAAKVLTNICVNNEANVERPALLTTGPNNNHERPDSLFQGVSKTNVSVDFYCQR